MRQFKPTLDDYSRELAKATTASQAQAERKPLTEDQQKAVAYFFARLEAIYPQQYQSTYRRGDPDAQGVYQAERVARKEYARYVMDLTPEQQEAGFKRIHAEKQRAPESWRWLDIDRVIGALCDSWEHRRILQADAEAKAAKRLPDLGKRERAQAAYLEAMKQLGRRP